MRQLQIIQTITQRTDETINRYFQEIIKYPMISAEEEVELAILIRQGEEDALKKMVLSNLRFVVSVAKQYQHQGISLTDLINEGNLGLIKAARRFDEKRGFKFISYAVWWIRQGMIQAISEQSRIVRLPLNRVASINKIKNIVPHIEQELEREPTDDEIAEYLEYSHDDVSLAMKLNRRQMSLDVPLSSNGDSGLNFYDLLESDGVTRPDSRIVEESRTITIHRALNKLTQRESTVLIMSFGLFDTPSYSMENIAFKFNITRERVRQIRSNGLFKLKKLLTANHSLLED